MTSRALEVAASAFASELARDAGVTYAAAHRAVASFVREIRAKAPVAEMLVPCEATRVFGGVYPAVCLRPTRPVPGGTPKCADCLCREEAPHG